MSENKRNEKTTGKEYSIPKVIHTEKLEGRAVVCALADDASCGAGPIMS